MANSLVANPFIALWHNISRNALFVYNIKEYIKLAKIACVQVLKSVKDEKTFNTLVFLKNKL